MDSLLLQTLGISSLVLLSVGYLAGRYREGFEIRDRTVPALLCGGFTLLAAAGFAAIELMLGVDATVSILVVREILVQGLLGVLLGFAVYPLVRRALGPALFDYEPRAGRLLSAGRLRRRGPRRRRGTQRRPRPRAPRPSRVPSPPPRCRVAAGTRRPRRTPVHGGIAMMLSDWKRPTLPAQLNVRVAVLAGIGLTLFLVIFLRLWYLQVLSGDQYLAQAQNNQIRDFTVQAPRGDITRPPRPDVLVDNRTALELQVKPTDLPNSAAPAGEAVQAPR